MRVVTRVIHNDYECDCKAVCRHLDMDMIAEHCGSSSLIYHGVTAIWESCVYPKIKFQEWYNKGYLMGSCGLCGLELLPLCPDEGNTGHENEDEDLSFD